MYLKNVLLLLLVWCLPFKSRIAKAQRTISVAAVNDAEVRTVDAERVSLALHGKDISAASTDRRRLRKKCRRRRRNCKRLKNCFYNDRRTRNWRAKREGQETGKYVPVCSYKICWPLRCWCYGAARC